MVWSVQHVEEIAVQEAMQRCRVAVLISFRQLEALGRGRKPREEGRGSLHQVLNVARLQLPSRIVPRTHPVD